MSDIPGGLRSLPLLARTVTALRGHSRPRTAAGSSLLVASVGGHLMRMDPAIDDAKPRTWSSWPDGLPVSEPAPSEMED